MEENKQVINKKAGFEKNLTVPILVVVMLTGLAVWFVPDDEEDIDLKKPLPQLDSVIQPLDSEVDGSDLPPLDNVSTIRPLEEIESGSGEAVPKIEDVPDPSEQKAVVKHEDDDVRTLIAQFREDGSDSGQKAYEAAEKKRRLGENEDAYLLYFFAARHGHGDAAFVLGTMADPAYYTSITSALDAPDIAQAVKWYKKAIAAGNENAKRNLADLSRRIKKQAEAGSSEAQRLLLQLR